MGPQAEPPHDSQQPAQAARVEAAPLPAEPAVSAGVDLNALVSEHHAAVYRYAYRLTGSVHDAEDLTQQAFLVAREKLDQVRDARHVRGWLCAVLRNCYLRTFRQQTPTPAATLGLNLDGFAEEADDSPIDSEQLQLALLQLPGDFRLVLLMFYFEQLSYREIADALAVPLGTVMSRLSRAKSCLRTLLGPVAAASQRPLADNQQSNNYQEKSPRRPPESERPDPRLPETTTSFLSYSPGSAAPRG